MLQLDWVWVIRSSLQIGVVSQLGIHALGRSVEGVVLRCRPAAAMESSRSKSGMLRHARLRHRRADCNLRLFLPRVRIRIARADVGGVSESVWSAMREPGSNVARSDGRRSATHEKAAGVVFAALETPKDHTNQNKRDESDHTSENDSQLLVSEFVLALSLISGG